MLSPFLKTVIFSHWKVKFANALPGHFWVTFWTEKQWKVTKPPKGLTQNVVSSGIPSQIHKMLNREELIRNAFPFLTVGVAGFVILLTENSGHKSPSSHCIQRTAHLPGPFALIQTPRCNHKLAFLNAMWALKSDVIAILSSFFSSPMHGLPRVNRSPLAELAAINMGWHGLRSHRQCECSWAFMLVCSPDLSAFVSPAQITRFSINGNSHFQHIYLMIHYEKFRRRYLVDPFNVYNASVFLFSVPQYLKSSHFSCGFNLRAAPLKRKEKRNKFAASARINTKLVSSPLKYLLHPISRTFPLRIWRHPSSKSRVYPPPVLWRTPVQGWAGDRD